MKIIIKIIYFKEIKIIKFKRRTTLDEENNKTNTINNENNLEEISTSKKNLNKKNNIESAHSISSLSILSNDGFTEFTYILIKNLEAKKITEEKAKELSKRNYWKIQKIQMK